MAPANTSPGVVVIAWLRAPEQNGPFQKQFVLGEGVDQTILPLAASRAVSCGFGLPVWEKTSAIGTNRVWPMVAMPNSTPPSGPPSDRRWVQTRLPLASGSRA